MSTSFSHTPGSCFKCGPSVTDSETGTRHSKGKDWFHPQFWEAQFGALLSLNHHKIWPKELGFTWDDTGKKRLLLFD